MNLLVRRPASSSISVKKSTMIWKTKKFLGRGEATVVVATLWRIHPGVVMLEASMNCRHMLPRPFTRRWTISRNTIWMTLQAIGLKTLVLTGGHAYVLVHLCHQSFT